MNKITLLKSSIGLLAAMLCLTAVYGISLLAAPEAKLLCIVLSLIGAALAGLVYLLCRIEILQMVNMLEDTLLAAEQGQPPAAGNFTEERITHRLCLRAIRLAEATNDKARIQEATQAELQAAVSDLAHQLRAPVANLMLYADTLATGDLSPQTQTEFIAVLGGQASKLDFLVDALVKTGRLETGAIQMVPRIESLQNTLNQAAALAKPLAAAKGLTFLIDCPADLILPHDPKWTAEAIFNLLDNAIKYTTEGSVSLTARRWEVYTCIEVTDTGIGIVPEEAAQLFARFYRAPQVAASPGVGLGLYIVRQIAQLQGGYVQAKALEQGSVFRLFLPNA